mgnify:CR=1 FL=1
MVDSGAAVGNGARDGRALGSAVGKELGLVLGLEAFLIVHVGEELPRGLVGAFAAAACEGAAGDGG